MIVYLDRNHITLYSCLILMENFDFGRAINMFLVAFVIFIVIMIAFVARLVSTFMARNKSTSVTSTYAKSIPPAESQLEIAHTTTISLTRISENYLTNTEEERQLNYEVLLTIAQARKQAIDSLFEEDPTAILSTLFPDDLRTNLPSEAQTFIEAQIITEGRFKVLQIPNQPEKRYSLIAKNGEEYKLYFTTGLPQLPPNSAIRVRGVRLGNKMLVQSIEETSL